jgi:hypothetical protein
LNTLKEEFTEMKHKFEHKICPTKEFVTIVDMLEQILEDPERLVHSNPEVKKFFFEEMVGGLTRRITLNAFDNEEVSSL